MRHNIVLRERSEGRARHEGDRAPEWRLLPEGNSDGLQIDKRILPHVGNLADEHGDLAAVIRDDQSQRRGACADALRFLA